MSVKKTLLSTLVLASALISTNTFSQTEKYLEQLKKDTSNNKISINLKAHQDTLENLVEQKKEKQNNYFVRGEIDKRKFVIEYHRLVGLDKLNEAQELIAKKQKSMSGKENTLFRKKELYKKYAADIKQRIKEQNVELHTLVQKKRKFKRKFKKISKGDSLGAWINANDFSLHAQQYAQTHHIPAPWIQGFIGYSKAKAYDVQYEDENIEKILRRKGRFLRKLKPFIQSGELEEYYEGMNLIDTCILYAKNAWCRVDKKTLLRQKNKFQNLIQREERDLVNDELIKKGLSKGDIYFKNDTLNKEGIYSFNEEIIVITTYHSLSNAKNMIVGDGGRAADKILLRYLYNEELISKKQMKKGISTNKTKIYPYLQEFQIEPIYKVIGSWYQIRARYKKIGSKRFTQQIIDEELSPIILDTNYQGHILEDQQGDKRIEFYRNHRGSKMKVYSGDTTYIFTDKESTNYENGPFKNKIDKIEKIYTQFDKEYNQKKKIKLVERYLKKGKSKHLQIKRKQYIIGQMGRMSNEEFELMSTYQGMFKKYARKATQILKKKKKQQHW